MHLPFQTIHRPDSLQDKDFYTLDSLKRVAYDKLSLLTSCFELIVFTVSELNHGNRDSVCKLMDAYFPGIQYNKLCVMPMRMAHMHTDKVLAGNAILSIILSSSVPYVLKGVLAKEGSDLRMAEFNVHDGFILDPESWHCFLPSKSGHHYCTMIQAECKMEDVKHLLT